MQNGWYRIKGTKASPDNHGNVGAFIDGKLVLAFNDGVFNRGIPTKSLAKSNLSAPNPEGSTYYVPVNEFGDVYKNPANLEFVAPISHDSEGVRIGYTTDCKAKLKDGWWKAKGWTFAIKNGRVVCGRGSIIGVPIPANFDDSCHSLTDPTANQFWTASQTSVGGTGVEFTWLYNQTEKDAEFLQHLDITAKPRKFPIKNGWYRLPIEEAPSSPSSHDWVVAVVDGRVLNHCTVQKNTELHADLSGAFLASLAGTATTAGDFHGNLTPNHVWYNGLTTDKFKFVAPITTLEGKPLTHSVNLTDGWYKAPAVDGLGNWIGLVENRVWVGFHWRMVPKGQLFDIKDVFGTSGDHRIHFDSFEPKDFEFVAANEAAETTPGPLPKTTLSNGWYRVPSAKFDVGTENAPWHGLVLDGTWVGFDRNPGVFATDKPVELQAPQEFFGPRMLKIFSQMQDAEMIRIRDATHDRSGKPLGTLAEMSGIKKMANQVLGWSTPGSFVSNPCGEVRLSELSPPEAKVEEKPNEDSSMWLALPVAGVLLAGLMASKKKKSAKAAQKIVEEVSERS